MLGDLASIHFFHTSKSGVIVSPDKGCSDTPFIVRWEVAWLSVCMEASSQLTLASGEGSHFKGS